MRVLFALSICLAVLLGIASAAAATSMTVNWKPTSLSADDCVERAEMLMRNAGLTLLTRTGSAQDRGAWGYTSDYLMNVRCIERKGMAVFIVSQGGDDISRRHAIMDAVRDPF